MMLQQICELLEESLSFFFLLHQLMPEPLVFVSQVSIAEMGILLKILSIFCCLSLVRHFASVFWWVLALLG